MRATNADVVAKEIQGYAEDVERRLRNMVAEFAYEAALAVAPIIPIGDAASIAVGLESKDPSDPTVAYANYYKKRKEDYGLEMEPGFHRNSLRYSKSGNFSFIRDIRTTEDMSQDIFNDASSYYEIGDNFSIGSSGPAYAALEGGSSEQAPNGILGLGLEAMQDIYKMDMKRFYDSSN